MKHDVSKTEYGNWVSLSLLKTITLLVVVFAVTTFVSFLPYVNDLMPGAALLWLLRALSAILLCLSVWALAVFRKAHHIFSYSGGRLSAKVISYVAGHVRCEGRVRVLDIGCGSGALAIEMAKRFPQAEVTGIDFWGAGWDYGKAQCERNARIEGVDRRTVFMQGDAAKLPFADGEFDVAVSNFVFHEVKSQADKRKVIGEALRVVKPGGSFAFHDLFYDKSKYGDAGELAAWLKGQAADISLKPTADELDVPVSVRKGIFLKNIGIIYGRK